MAKGVEHFHFQFMLCDSIPIDCHSIFRFGVVDTVLPQFQGKTLNISEYLFDDDNDFITLSEYLLELAQELYETQDEVVFVPE